MYHGLANNISIQYVLYCVITEGFATGGGAELATYTDFRILANDACVHFVQVTVVIVDM